MIKLKDLILEAGYQRHGTYEQHSQVFRNVFIPAIISPPNAIDIIFGLEWTQKAAGFPFEIHPDGTYIVSVDVRDNHGERKINLNLLLPQQYEQLEKFIMEYVEKHKEELEQEIAEQEDDQT